MTTSCLQNSVILTQITTLHHCSMCYTSNTAQNHWLELYLMQRMKYISVNTHNFFQRVLYFQYRSIIYGSIAGFSTKYEIYNGKYTLFFNVLKSNTIHLYMPVLQNLMQMYNGKYTYFNVLYPHYSSSINDRVVQDLTQHMKYTAVRTLFIRPFEKRDVLCYGVWRPSVLP